MNIPKGPWYCDKCLITIGETINKDITIDFVTLIYLSEGELPQDYKERKRVLKRGSRYLLRDERVYYLSKKGIKLVPTISER